MIYFYICNEFLNMWLYFGNSIMWYNIVNSFFLKCLFILKYFNTAVK